MISPKHVRLVFLIVVFCSSVARAQVIPTSQGNVEFIGLEKWTPKMIQERLGYESSDELHYCAQDLKKKLGFPDAAVFRYSKENGFTTVTVVEPQYAHLVQYRLAPSRQVRIPSEWQLLVKMVADETNWRNPEFWSKAVRFRKDRKDYALALRVLAQDGSAEKRIVAATILVNFAGRDGAWHALLDALRDSEPRVSSVSMSVLTEFANSLSNRRIDWLPVAPGIRHLLNGTNPFALPIAVRTLLSTGDLPRLARVVLGNGGGRMLLAYLRATHSFERNLAHEMLVGLSGIDLGFDSTSWRSWIDGLK